MPVSGGYGGQMPASSGVGMPPPPMGDMQQGGMMPQGGMMQGGMSGEQMQQMQKMQGQNNQTMPPMMMGSEMRQNGETRLPAPERSDGGQVRGGRQGMQGDMMRGQMSGRGDQMGKQGMMGQQGTMNQEGTDFSAQNEQNDEREAKMKKQQLAQWAKQSTQYEKQVKKLRSDLEKAKKKKDVAQYPTVLSQVETEVAAVESQWGEIKGLAASEDMEGVMGAVSDLHDAFADAQRSIGFLSQLSSVSKMVKNADREITSFEKQVARLEKKKIDVSSVRSLIAEARAKLAEIKALGSKSDVSPDDYFSLMEDLGDLRQQAVEEFNQLNGAPQSSALGAAVFQAIESRRLGF